MGLRVRMPEGPPPGDTRPTGPATPRELEALAAFLRAGPAVVLAGAGCSTESGIPDYRGPGSGKRDRRPMLYQEFLRDPDARARYWTRSVVGWPRFSLARPNPAHEALAALEHQGWIRGVISQNVDGLHHAAGSRQVVELHGSLGRVICLDCGGQEAREEVQERLRTLNPEFRIPGTGRSPGEEGSASEKEPALLADGDAVLPAGSEAGFRPPPCLHCGGILKPDVVFFGENVPRPRVREAWDLYEKGHSLLVVGSSLTVFSGRRFTLRAARDGRPVAIVNLGPTRGDEVSRLKVEDRVGRILPRVVALLN